MLNKRWITLPVVYRRPFASKAVFWAILKDFEFAVFLISQAAQVQYESMYGCVIFKMAVIIKDLLPFYLVSSCFMCG